MKHQCSYCKLKFDCQQNNCNDIRHNFCSIKCKNNQATKKDVQEELSKKIFPNGEWH